MTSTCTDLSAILRQIQENQPKLASTAGLEEVRQALVDYYAASSKTVGDAVDHAEAVGAPDVPNGAAIDKAYRSFLSGLVDIFYNAVLDISSAQDLSAIRAVNDKVDTDVTALANDSDALGDLQNGELASLAKKIPACKPLQG
ncbi:hypothetical protein [Nakamurella endophytica]|uniref:hypothetical protein n=1 Tax=Nakamurella endophytica TaxID=1748367 RepID=UPI00166A4DBD|nr:hypothetical protein [Nakamurella endophytica]